MASSPAYQDRCRESSTPSHAHLQKCPSEGPLVGEAHDPSVSGAMGRSEHSYSSCFSVLSSFPVCNSQEVLLRRYAFEFCCPFQELNRSVVSSKRDSCGFSHVLIKFSHRHRDHNIEFKCRFKSRLPYARPARSPICAENCLSQSSFVRRAPTCRCFYDQHWAEPGFVARSEGTRAASGHYSS